eukprot:UC1_evm1s2004
MPPQINHSDRAEFLELASPLPTKIKADQMLPDIEVRVMTTTRQERDLNGKPVPIPLLHGEDTRQLIEMTISHELKIFALDDYVGDEAGMDVTPLLYSSVALSGIDVQKNGKGDLVVRKEMELLPSGYYGAIFSNFAFDQVHEGIKLNFTMIIKGGPVYKELRGADAGTNMAEAFSRIGLGLGHSDGLNGSLYANPADMFDFLTPFEPYKSFRDEYLYDDLSRGYDDHRIAVSDLTDTNNIHGINCTRVGAGVGEDVRRRIWCEQSGHTVDPTLSAPRNILITDPISVVGRNGTALRLDWNDDLTIPVHHHRRFFHPMSIELLDDEMVLVASGHDSALRVNVTAVKDDGLGGITEAQLCDDLTNTGIYLNGGVVIYPGSVCEASATGVVMTFTTVTTAGVQLSLSTPAFTVTAITPLVVAVSIGVKVDPLALDYRMIKLAAEEQEYGVNDAGKNIYQFGRTPGFGWDIIFLDVGDTAVTMLAALDKALEEHHFHMLVGPNEPELASAAASWGSSNLPDGFVLMLTPGADEHRDTTVFPNTLRLAYTPKNIISLIVGNLAAHAFTKIVIVQSRASAPLSEQFYAECRSKGIDVAADLSLDPEDIGKPLEAQVSELKATGVRIVFVHLTTGLATHFFTEAVRLGFDGARGYHADFSGNMLSGSVSSDLTWTREQGGLDPLRNSYPGFSLVGLNRFAFGELALLYDSITMAGWPAMKAFDAKASIDYRNTWSITYGLSNMITLDASFDRIGATICMLQ